LTSLRFRPDAGVKLVENADEQGDTMIIGSIADMRSPVLGRLMIVPGT
jgi:hypothetical protein